MVVTLLIGCNSKPQAIFYLENGSFDMPKVELAIYLADSLIIKDTVEVDSIVPHFSIHRLVIPAGSHSITAKAINCDVVESVRVNMEDDRYIFIGFNYRVKGEHEYEEEKMKFDVLYPKEKHPDKLFEFDSISTPPEISIQVLDEEPVLR